jgi:hypothetical protein
VTSEIEQRAAKNFPKDVEDHKLTVALDQGEYRHLRVDNGSSTYHYGIVTWPGYLTIYGDMGSYVFSRVRDMFAFFRADRHEPDRINPGYWSEKLQAPKGTREVQNFSERVWRDHVRQWADDYVKFHMDDPAEFEREIEDGSVSPDDFQYIEEERDEAKARIMAFRAAGERELLTDEVYSSEVGHQLIERWNDEHGSDGWAIEDGWEWNPVDWDYSFIWCCHAIVHAIKLYDEQTTTKGQTHDQ